MSYEEKGTWVYLVIAIVGYTVYLSLVLPQARTRSGAAHTTKDLADISRATAACLIATFVPIAACGAAVGATALIRQNEGSGRRTPIVARISRAFA